MRCTKSVDLIDAIFTSSFVLNECTLDMNCHFLDLIRGVLPLRCVVGWYQLMVFQISPFWQKNWHATELPSLKKKYLALEKFSIEGPLEFLATKNLRTIKKRIFKTKSSYFCRTIFVRKAVHAEVFGFQSSIKTKKLKSLWHQEPNLSW